MTDPARPQTVLDFWFDPTTKPFWFVKDPGFDERVRAALGPAHAAAAAGALDGWQDSADGTLALVVLLDQVPRNIFRDSTRMYATDAAALAIARRGLARGFDLGVDSDRKLFLYLPFEHAEDLADQRTCLDLITERIGEPILIDFAQRHLRIIERFGRFPHRNSLLGRPSTPDELAFLDQPGSGF